MQVGDKVAQLDAIETNLLAFAGETDNLVQPEMAEKIVEIVASKDKEFRVRPGWPHGRDHRQQGAESGVGGVGRVAGRTLGAGASSKAKQEAKPKPKQSLRLKQNQKAKTKTKTSKAGPRTSQSGFVLQGSGGSDELQPRLHSMQCPKCSTEDTGTVYLIR